ncbi:MAG: hypothetical protein QNJ04_05210 [Desulfobacterales bacterium]|nr:hypothetical protein [Desulfobacterales bacterium]
MDRQDPFGIGMPEGSCFYAPGGRMSFLFEKRQYCLDIFIEEQNCNYVFQSFGTLLRGVVIEKRLNNNRI